MKIILCKWSPLRHLCKWKYSYFLMGTPFKALNKIWKTEIVNLGKVNKSFFANHISYQIRLSDSYYKYHYSVSIDDIFKCNRKFLKHILGNKFIQYHTLIVCLIRVWWFWIEAKFCLFADVCFQHLFVDVMLYTYNAWRVFVYRRIRYIII